MTKNTVTKTVEFTSKYMNTGKLNQLKEIEENVRVLKNKMSVFVYDNIFELLETGYMSFAGKYYKQYKGLLTVDETVHLLQDICKNYLVMVKKHIKNTDFTVQKDFKVTYYKRDTKFHKKGDVKIRLLTKKKSSLNGLLKYLLFVKDFDKITNKDILFQLNQYSEEKKQKIFAFIRKQQEKIFSKIHVIEYKNGTYKKDGYQTSAHLKDAIFEDNTNGKYKDWYAYKINDGFIYLPLQKNKKYHKNYRTNAWHTVQLDGNKLNIFTSKEELKPVFNTEGEVIGIDINVVNNFIAASDGYILDYDREYLKKMYKLNKKIDSIGYNNLSKNQLKQLRKLVRRNEAYFQRLIHEFLMYCIENDIYEVVMENLNFRDKCNIFDKETGLKYSKIVKLLRLSNIKNWLKSQAEKLGIRVHITPSQYTSQQCPVCGYIDEDNRPTQEVFECKNCGHTDNADHNASVNIKNRFTEDVLRKSKQIHSFDEYGRMIPCSKNKTIIKQILLSVFDT